MNFFPGPLRPSELRRPELFHEALARGGYTPDALARTIAIGHPSETLDLELALRRTSPASEYHTLVRLFLLAQSVPEVGARAALEPVGLDELVACGLLAVEGSNVRSQAKLVPYSGLYCASDFNMTENRAPLPPEHVLNVGPASITLANLSVRTPGGSLFDLGCGSGIQSLLASRECSRVIGSDTSLRALNFASFNSRLNGCESIEWREGSFFDPVQTEEFDAVVANPPFVISPGTRFIFRDGGLGGDRVSEHVLRGAAARLREGGFASMLINWHHADGDWSRRPYEWAADNGCDMWLILSSDADPLTYAAKWLKQSEGQDSEGYRRRLDEWLAYYESAGIGRIAAGEVILRKRAGKNWRRADVMEIFGAAGDCGAHIRQVFANEDFFVALPDDRALLGARFRLSESLVVQQDLAWEPGGWTLKKISLSLAHGLPFGGEGDGAMMRLLGWMDGTRPLEELLRQLSSAVDLNYERLVDPTLEVLRNLIRATVVIPVDA